MRILGIRPSPRRLSLFAVLLTVALCAVWLAWRSTADELLEEAAAALSSAEYALALRRAEQALDRDAELVEARLIAGEAATRLGFHEQAVAHYAAIPEDGSEASVTALYCTGDLLFHLGEARRAEEHYRRVLAHRPGDLWSHEQLGKLLGTFGRRWESVPHLTAQVESGQFTIEQVLFLGDTQVTLAAPLDLEKFRQRAPEDPLPLLALARAALDRNEVREAAQVAREVVQRDPGLLEGWAVFGRALFEGEPESLATWHSSLPVNAEEHPDVWFVRGLWSRQRQDEPGAVRCFAEAVRRAPDHRAAHHQLGQALAALGQSEHAVAFLERAERLQRLEIVLNQIYRSPLYEEKLPVHGQARSMTLALFREAAELTESLGRLWEAWAWQQIALAHQPDLVWARSGLERVRGRLRPGTPRVLAESEPVVRIDLSLFPLPSLAFSSPAPEHELAAATSAGDSPVRFVDVAALAGIDFQYVNGTDPPALGNRLLQVMGGGVAVLDYDGDDWPDLYFTQGGPVPLSNSQEHADRLYRNLGTGRFADVTGPSGLGSTDFSHGATVGDFNADGFPDLYVANAGRNRLYQNNGDGTFVEVTRQAGLSSERWTTSCLLADLNGNGLPDIYDVNYLAGRESQETICHSDGRDRTCGPIIFPGEQDTFLLNLGDGTFEEMTREAGLLTREGGKGLGLVAADLSGDGRLSLFVANDTSPNFYFVNETPAGAATPRFRETGLLAGLALDASCFAQGCMGIAMDDADGDGMLDLFVTNVFEESNALYLQRGRHLFDESSRAAGLRDSSFSMVGFGTQFLDADLDGFPDLIIANGHISDERDKGRALWMAPQFFRNLGGGRFSTVEASSVGEWFEGAYLGRGLARLDWNRDGKEDFAVSHLDTPAALLMNLSQTGNALSLQLRGTVSGRDAIGTTVVLTAGGRSWTRQLTAGDGYLASNERQLVFGLGPAERVDRIEIRWRSGETEVFRDAAAGQRLLCVERRGILFRLPQAAAALPGS